MTENIKILMIIDKYNHKSIRSYKTIYYLQQYIVWNDGILFNIQVDGYINKDNIIQNVKLESPQTYNEIVKVLKQIFKNNIKQIHIKNYFKHLYIRAKNFK